MPAFRIAPWTRRRGAIVLRAAVAISPLLPWASYKLWGADALAVASVALTGLAMVAAGYGGWPRHAAAVRAGRWARPARLPGRGRDGGRPQALGLAGALAPRAPHDPSPGHTAAHSPAPAPPDGDTAAGASIVCPRPRGAAACVVLALDDGDGLAMRHGHIAYGAILRLTESRLRTVLRAGDHLARLDGGAFAIMLGPDRPEDLDLLMRIATRLQEAAGAPIALETTLVRVSFSAGLCLRALAEGGGDDGGLLNGAETALAAARRAGPGQLCAFSDALRNAEADRRGLRDRLPLALSNGEIRAFFQPQLCCNTGVVTGFEALARWVHPALGILAPGRFLPEVTAQGLDGRLGHVMLQDALTALVAWSRAGIEVPSVGVNFSAGELGDPALPERVKWELDRHDLAPERLTVEVLEDVVAQAGCSRIEDGIAQLSRLGCRIDLDDFGTGQASIANIRRFSVGRLKIDRSLVTGLDRDMEQHRTVAAILSLAERLGLPTLAEGVETPAEHAALAQLGCDHVQGFAISRPMPPELTLQWLFAHRPAAGAPQPGLSSIPKRR